MITQQEWYDFGFLRACEDPNVYALQAALREALPNALHGSLERVSALRGFLAARKEM